MATRMQQRRGTAAQWTAANPTLAAGEIGFETDTNQFKIGNGSSAWAALSYFKNLDGLDGVGGIVTLNAQGMIDIALIPQGVALDAELTQYIEDHNTATTTVHGISNTANLVYQTQLTDTVNDSIALEVTDRNTAITNAIALEVTDRNTAITNAIALEATNRNTAIDGAIELEVTNRNTAIDDAIALEVSARDEAIDDAITLEVTNRNTAIDGAIALEVSARDEAINDAISQEVTDRNDAIGTQIGLHNADTTEVHGIADTAALATKTYADNAASAVGSSASANLTAHNTATINVHGIADTAALATKTYADNAVSTAVGALTKSSVGLNNVDNTSDANKPVSTATQSALDLKAPLASPTFTGTVVLPTVDAGGSIVPSTDNLYDLGSPTKMWKDIYVGPGSLYVNGQKVIQDDSGNIVLSADANENLALRTSGSGNVELDPTGTGTVNVKGPLVVEAGANFSSADGNGISFSNGINTDSITSKTSNTDLSLSGNGTGKVYLNDNAEVNGNLVVGGNLTVSGTTTTVNSETISLADNVIDLNSNFTTGSPTENAGLRVMRGDSNAVQVRWNESSDVWEFTKDGANYSTIAGLDSPTFTGTVTIPAGASISGYAPTASPTFTGTVTVAANGIAFTDGTQTKEGVPSRTTITQTTGTYDLSSGGLSLRDGMLEVSHTGGTAVDITIPANSTTAYPVGTSIDILRTNTGGVRIVGAAGVTVNATPGAYLRAQWSAATLFKRATDTWVLIGDLATA